jgi:glycerol 2-dehydrogenase (NADP+)
VYHALTVAGIRHVDCAFAYGNETEVGRAFARVFAEGAVARSDVFVTTKLWGTWHTRAAEALDESLARLGLEYVDLYLMHWPIPLNAAGNDALFPTTRDGTRDVLRDWTPVDTWTAMEKLVAAGKTKVRYPPSAAGARADWDRRSASRTARCRTSSACSRTRPRCRR